MTAEKPVILKSKERKQILNMMKNQWDSDVSEIKENVFVKTPTGKIFISSFEAAEMEQAISVRKYSYGNYIGTEMNNQFRASIEGSQFIGPKSKKNIIELDETQIKEWIAGKDLVLESNCKGICLIRHKIDFVGCGVYKDGKLMNYVPKTRRLQNL